MLPEPNNDSDNLRPDPKGLCDPAVSLCDFVACLNTK